MEIVLDRFKFGLIRIELLAESWPNGSVDFLVRNGRLPKRLNSGYFQIRFPRIEDARAEFTKQSCLAVYHNRYRPV